MINMKNISARLVSLISIILLTSCASPGDMRKEKADLQFTSQKSAKFIAVCIADNWENGGLFGNTVPVNMRPTTTGYTLSWINGMGGTGLLVDVDDTQLGSKTNYFRGGVIGAGKFEEALNSCQ